MKTKMNDNLRLLTVFMFLFTFSSLAGFAFSQGEKSNLVKQERTLPSFDKIEAGGAFRIFLSQGEKQSVLVEAGESVINDIETSVKSGRLIISTRRSLKDPGVMNIFITVETLKELDISGAVNLKSETRFTVSDLKIDCSGAAKIMLSVSGSHLDLDCSGAGNIELLGALSSMELELSGAANLEAVELELESLKAEISGASKAKVNVSGELSVEVSGAGSLRYMGEPELRKTSVSGAGSIKKM